MLLDADEAVLRRRIGARRGPAWRLDHLAGFRAARPWMTPAADLVVDTTALAPGEVASRIAAALPGPGPG